MSTSKPVVQVKDLVVDLGDQRIIDHITFSVPEESTTAIIGPNGAGKSVLIKALLRLIPKTSGEVLLFDTPHEHYRKIAAQVSYIPQRLNIERNFPLTVAELFKLKSGRSWSLFEKDQARTTQLLEMVGLTNHLHKKIGELSGGQLQRALLAYSLVDHPKLLILDEPSAGIDSTGQETMYHLLQRIQKTEHITMMLISHELDIVMQYADQVLCVNQKLLCAGVPSEVLSNEMLQSMYGTPIQHFHHDHNGH